MSFCPAAAKGHQMCVDEHDNDFPVVLVISNHAFFRETLSKLCQSVGLKVLAFDSIAGFLGANLPDAPTCLVIDASSPALRRVNFHAELARADVQIPIVPVAGAMNVGAIEILTRRLRDRSMLATIQIALQMDRARREVTKRATTH
jgi:FixJ family two-component response regulator